MFDVFYLDQKPNLFVHEKFARNVDCARKQSRTRFFWIVSYLADYTEWNWLWEPPPWQSHQCHVWPSQWQRNSGTMLLPKQVHHDVNYRSDRSITMRPSDQNWHIPRYIDGDCVDKSWHPDFDEPPWIYEFGTQWQKTGGAVYTVPGATKIKYVSTQRIVANQSCAKAVIIDHLDGNLNHVVNQTQSKIDVVKTTRFVNSYLDTFLRISKQVDEECIWIVSSVCDYSEFDFTWYPEQWQSSMLHVFASNELKFGDTFFMHVPTFRDRAGCAKLLEWYDVNFVDQSVPRRPVPVIVHDNDSHVDSIRNCKTRAPVTLFANETTPTRVPAVNLWRPEVRAVTPLDAGACCVLVPRDAISQINTQVYDYAIIDKTHMADNVCKPLDIIFISNGEVNADANWNTLLHHTRDQLNRCVRVDGVNGRAAAYHAAAEASKTAWFFAVFAKLEVLGNFDWSWQPDRLQQPKHYIFHALNPVNMLEYGHQAMIVYNKTITLANPGRGLDFTLDDAHEVVPVLSGVARYNVDPWTTWRTAFREVIKLRASLPDVENEYRMKKWLTVGNGPYGEFSCYGAQDALDYYEEVNGDFAELRKSYEWAWLASYAMMLHPELVIQSRT